MSMNTASKCVWILLLWFPSFGNCLKCYGSNAFDWKANGLPECYNQFFANSPLPDCWTQCGGITYIKGTSPQGTELCPYKRYNVNKITTLTEKGSELLDFGLHTCHCDLWRDTLPGNSCPSCDDFDKIPPMILSHFDDATRDKRAVLGDCPPEYDSCFNFCVDDGEWVKRPGFLWGTSSVPGATERHCFYGCAKSSIQQALELMVSTKLAELDYSFR